MSKKESNPAPTARKPRAAAKKAPVAEATAAPAPNTAGGIVLSPQQVQGLKQMFGMIQQPQIAWNPDVEPVLMANAIIKNSQQAAAAGLGMIQQAEEAAKAK